MDTNRIILAQTLDIIFNQIHDETQARLYEGGDVDERLTPRLSSDVLRRLQGLLKEEQLIGSMELVENVTLVQDDTGRKIFCVESLTRKGHFYHCYFGVYYCSCSHITPQNMNRICKHIIASRIAFGLNTVNVKEVSTSEMCEKFAHFDDV